MTNDIEWRSSSLGYWTAANEPGNVDDALEHLVHKIRNHVEVSLINNNGEIRHHSSATTRREAFDYLFGLFEDKIKKSKRQIFNPYRTNEELVCLWWMRDKEKTNRQIKISELISDYEIPE